MQSNRSSVMDNLYKIGDKISEASSGKEATSANQNTASSADNKTNVSAVSQSSTLSKALLRRYDDFLKSKRDLMGRIAAECETQRHNQENARLIIDNSESVLKQLEEYMKIVQDTDSDFDPADQYRLAMEYRKIENIRVEVIRLQSMMKNLSGPGSSTANSGIGFENILDDLESLTLSQLFRFGWAIFLPLFIAAIVAALLIGAAIILSYNGVFLWR